MAGDKQHQFQVSGQHYRVIRPFVDYDRDVHPMGEEWIFLGCQFVPYHGPWSDFLVNRIAERASLVPAECGQISGFATQAARRIVGEE